MGAAPNDPPRPGESPRDASPAGEPERFGPLLVARFVKRDARTLILYERPEEPAR